MFNNKVVVITGSTQGIGYRTAEKLAIQGAKIVVNSRSPKKVQDAISKLLLISPHITGMAGDVSDSEFCEQLKCHAIHHFGHVDILINNAGLAAKGDIGESSPQAFELIFSINVLGSLYPTLAFLPEIKQQKGSILFISSIAGIIGLPSYSAYSASKRAIVSLAESLKNELIDDQVFVGVNYPGFTENDPQKKIVNPHGLEINLNKRTEVAALPLDKTVNCILDQIRYKKFRAYSTPSGHVVQWLYQLSPAVSLFILKINRHKIRKMQ
jgi:NAD(P)-dependent dehydrogenase (short-subunit alcohol dehydrogenase family)